MKRSTAYIHSAPQPPRDMLAAGIDIIPDKKNNPGAKREKRGECPTCGMPTHKVSMFGKPKPLTVEGQVYKGRCLVCHPLEGYIRRPPPGSGGGNNNTNVHGSSSGPAHQQPFGGVGGPHRPQHFSPPLPAQPQQQQSRGSFRLAPNEQQQFQQQQQQQQQIHSQNAHNSYSRYPPMPPQQDIYQQQQHYQQQQQQYFLAEPFHPAAESGITIPQTLRVNEMGDDVSVITMDAHLVQAARNWTPGAPDIVDVSDDEDETEMNLPPVPIPGRRPGPDSGDSYAGRNDGVTATSATAGARAGPPPRNAPSYRGGFPPGGGDSGMEFGGPHSRASVGGGLGAGMGGSYRRSPVVVPPSLSATQEHAPERSYRHLIASEEEQKAAGGYGPPNQGQMQASDEYGGVAPHGPAFDEDGYPIATSGYGWDKQADLLPPGGMDMLLRNRSGEVRLSVTSNRRPSSATNGEIRFQPLIEEPASEPFEDVEHLMMLETPVETTPPQNNEYPLYGGGGGAGAEIQESNIRKPQRVQRIASLESGPMFLPDDVPGYSYNTNMEDGVGAPAMTRLETQRSEPLRIGVVRQDAAGAAGDRLAALPPELRGHKTIGSASTGNRPPRPSLSDHSEHGSSHGFGRTIPGTKFDSKHSIETGSHGASTMASTLAPPLVSRDRRGRPDDDMIHDPAMVAAQAQYAEGTESAERRASLDDQADDTPEIAPMSIPPSHTASSESRPLLKAPPTQYAPAPTRRVVGEFREPQGLRDSTISSGLMYIDDTDGPSSSTPLSSRFPVVDDDNMAAYTNQKAPPPPEENDDHITGVSPPSERVSEMVRKLSISPEQPKVPEMTQPAAQPAKGSQQTIDDIPVIMHCLNLKQSNADLRVKALRNLAAILWSSSKEGRMVVKQFKAVETLVKTMWDDMGNANVQDAAVESLLSLAASSDGEPNNDLLANEDSCCDSLLFAMQTHPDVPSIQMKGCAVFSCLAAASSNNSNVSDGSLSGAQMMVLSAMSHHSRSAEIQKAGLQALYYQCTLSSNAESNKRSLVESRVDNGASGLDVILCAMRSLREDLVAMEWACRLCWSLTSSEDLVNNVSNVPEMIQEIIEICQRNITSQESIEILEACFGVIRNMAYVDANHVELLQRDAVATLMEGMRYQPGDFSLNLEACSAIGNMAMSNPVRDAFLKAGALDSVLHALQMYMGSDEFVVEATRALVCLVMHSQEGKEAMVDPDVVGLVLAVSSKHPDSNSVQEMCCKLLATLAVDRAATNVIITNGGMHLLAHLLKSNSDERVQDAACSAYRNLACLVQDSDCLLEQGVLESVINAMKRHENSLSIQTNSCCAIWNIAFKTNKEPGALVGDQGIQVIVKAMQNHMESSDLLELACGALWSVIDESIERKKDVVGSGAIDAVVCTMVMHPATQSTLTKACGVFSNLSAEGPLASAIANAQGVSVVSDAMRNNATAIAFLEIGCLALRNIVVQLPEYAQEASMVISPIIDAMRDNITATSFQKAACNLLWVLAAEAESCQSKILALDGISVLVQCLEQNSHDAKVREAALGAFNQLTVNGNQ